MICNCKDCELKTLFIQNLTDLEIKKLCSQTTEKEYKKGETIIREGDDINEFTYLKKGLVKLYRKGLNNRDHILCFAAPLDFVSLLSIFSEKKYNYSVTALSDSVTCNMNLEVIKNLINENGKFATLIIQKVNKITDKIILDVLEVKQRRLFGRVAYILIYFSEQIFKESIFTLPVSRKELSEYIGMTVENVIRSLSEFRKDGIIFLDGQIIEILDMVRLKKISESS